MAYSTIPAAIDRLLIVLPARAGLAGVLIADAIPADLPAEDERVYVDDAINVRTEWAGLGQLRMDEFYTLQILVEVFTSAKNSDAAHRTTCRHRLYEIIAEVEQAAVLDITLAGVLNWGAKPGPKSPTIRPTDGGWLGQATVNLECSARIQAS